ncbi:WS/DGAT domain-containing protein [Haliangium sp.]|uniref:WS/DGAT domain-containing protein n=1 Tax=Haliangium sp. TaxID=2663208 RepID=UPI003D0F367F
MSEPGARFQVVSASMNEGKALLRGMSAKEIELFMLLTLTPGMLAGALGLGDRFSPHSVVVSNVRGPKERRYWNGACLDGFYPLGAIYHGYALNITLLSNAGRLDFGIVACRDTVPDAQRLGDDLRVALEDLERAAGLSPP